MTALDRELARALVAVLRDDPELRDELRGVLGAGGDAGAHVDQEAPRRWLTVTEAAGRLGCSPDAIRMRCSRGRLEHRRQGRRLYISAASVDRLA